LAKQGSFPRLAYDFTQFGDRSDGCLHRGIQENQ
jgi:hypothetical protein